MTGTPLRIFPNGDGMLSDVPDGKLVHVKEPDLRVSALAAGTTSGKPSVGIAITMTDGTVVFAETTLALFLTAADAFKAAHGDPRT